MLVAVGITATVTELPIPGSLDTPTGSSYKADSEIKI